MAVMAGLSRHAQGGDLDRPQASGEGIRPLRRMRSLPSASAGNDTAALYGIEITGTRPA